MVKSLKQRLFSSLPIIWDNPLSILGAGLTTAAAFVILTVLLLEWTGFQSNPYVGIMVYMLMPALFACGLLFIPLGNLIWRKRRARTGASGLMIIQMNLNDPAFQRRVMVVAGFSLLNIIIVSAVSYQAVTYMDSNTFCGQVCHSVMSPEYTSYQTSPHSRVHCVSCHIGSGASWFVKYKLSGLYQVYAVTTNNYPRPIPTPVENLRPARETCEQCHWPEKFSEDRVRILRKYAEDEQNSPTQTVLLMKVGGSHSASGKSIGIHWHTSKDNRVEYIATDRQRQTIPWVRLTQGDGTVVDYTTPDSKLTPEAIASAEKRVMDCVDCHNRPTHIYQLPDRALDAAMANGLVDSSIPFIRKQGLAALKGSYEGKEQGMRQIAAALTSYYEKEYPDQWKNRRDLIERSVAHVQDIYVRNIFPQMNVSWGTYSNNVGHTDFPGCFRCHDDNHKSGSGKVIRQDCETCHALLAVDETKPALIPEIFTKK